MIIERTLKSAVLQSSETTRMELVIRAMPHQVNSVELNIQFADKEDVVNRCRRITVKSSELKQVVAMLE